jgi:hypothetical protein
MDMAGGGRRMEMGHHVHDDSFFVDVTHFCCRDLFFVDP